MTLSTETDPAPVRPGALTSLALAMLMSSLGISVATVALPELSEHFSSSLANTQWVILAYLLAVTVAIVPIGRLGDTLGRRPILLVGILLFTLATLLASISASLSLLIAARGLQGLGAAIMMAHTVAAVRETVAPERTGRAMGLLGTMSATGTALGPALGGVLIDSFGWRAVFLALVPMGVFAFALAVRTLPGASRESGQSGGVDLIGSVVLGFILFLYALAMTAENGAFRWNNGAFLGAAFAGVVLFVSVERRVTDPLIDISALRQEQLAGALMMNTLVACVMMATLVVGPFLLLFGLRLNEMTVGFVMAVGPATAALGGIPAGRLTDRFGAGAVIIAGLAQMATGAFLLAVLPWWFGLPGYVAALVILALGYQLFLAALNTGVMMDVGEDRRGVVSSLLSLSRNLGLITGASAAGAVFTASLAGDPIANASPDAIAFAFMGTFAIAGALLFVAVGITTWRRLSGSEAPV